MVGDFLIGDYMSFKYMCDDLRVAVSITDVGGDFIDTLSEVECEVLCEGLDMILKTFCAAIKITRQGKESQDGLEG